MRCANSLRAFFLTALLIMGIVVHHNRQPPMQGDPDALTSLLPSPVKVIVLTGHRL